MKFVFAALLALACFCVTGAAENEKQAKATYEALVEKAKAGDKNVDFKQMRFSYSDITDAKDVDTEKKAMFDLLRAGKFAEAIKNADAVLTEDYVDLDAHVVEVIANRELKNTEQTEFHKYIYEQLMKSIMDSGDGKSPETAFTVIEVHEEYVVLKAMGIMGFPEQQSLLKKNGHSYDELAVEEPRTKKKEKIYFNVDIPTKHGL